MTKEKHLNIISFNIPDPPNYGGIIDVFYKLKALANEGVKIHLHCYSYGRDESTLLNNICYKVYYYKRKTGILSNLSDLPYIINSRKNILLVDRINTNGFPVLFEGLHTTYPLLKNLIVTSKICLRSHNLEHDYYYDLAKQESNWVKKLYFTKEGFLLKKALNKLNEGLKIGAISPADTLTLKQSFEHTFWLPPFHASNILDSKTGKGAYAIYHGNLSVPENISAVKFVFSIFNQIDYPLIITGKNPTQEIYELAKNKDNIQIIANPPFDEMNQLVENAHIVLLPTFQATGIKLKLIDSLYRGRFCLANNEMIKNTQLENLCTICNTQEEFINAIKTLQTESFTTTNIQLRQGILEKNYNNATNAKALIRCLFN